MKIAVAIPNHDQGTTVREAIECLLAQSVRPSHIFVMSDDMPLEIDYALYGNVIPINNREGKNGRCGNRNSVIVPFLRSGDDALVFIDGDCRPKDSEFVFSYEKLLSEHDLVFCMREHTSVEGIDLPASDLLTANMDNLWSGRPLDYRDLRIVSGAMDAWHGATSFTEKVDLMVTGMVGWSCNFGITRSGLERLTSFMLHYHGRRNEIFDSKAFSNGWGYEDVAMGLDAMYAGLDVWISENPVVIHRAHPRTDGLFDHVNGRHMIMSRYRSLHAKRNYKHYIGISAALSAASFLAGMLIACL